MFSPEKLLGGLIQSAISGKFRGQIGSSSYNSANANSAFSGLSRGASNLGLIGLAFAAFQHFSKSGQPSQSNQTNSSPLGQLGSFLGVNSPAASQLSPSKLLNTSDQARLLIRAMVAAAQCDGEIDLDEKNRMAGRIEQDGISEEERNFLNEALKNPPSIDELVAAANTPDLAEQVYGVSMLAIKVDSDVERSYLKNLAQALKLNLNQTDKWQQLLGIQGF